jgi:hypothetical protein
MSASHDSFGRAAPKAATDEVRRRRSSGIRIVVRRRFPRRETPSSSELAHQPGDARAGDTHAVRLPQFGVHTRRP